ncbi:hypothetical protein EH198_17220 [Paenibacillus rhizophilus]|uniref:Uncharacterized protein n=1 Tax=Paenibacillus rhizophilus TaxID=1850366 RepID=A0A3N9P0V9_9BACL|nr:hypothetical protein EH198_17220 [Paenibacillus rhizophilus]
MITFRNCETEFLPLIFLCNMQGGTPLPGKVRNESVHSAPAPLPSDGQRPEKMRQESLQRARDFELIICRLLLSRCSFLYPLLVVLLFQIEGKSPANFRKASSFWRLPGNPPFILGENLYFSLLPRN